ncbi:hypothetical protein RHMOL_Rhmol06G0029700 [Rhododendron molle]|uniref:Uncharacterized protein n=1 Tax=Rhododendron molle TaxID=49168 RepID=A0ACC0N883_RHOML|nr:hypothetical protein RHMOL_Rhmol06G0029700 [Rhododendron molle]
MDRSRDVRRGGASRFSPAKRHTMSYHLDMKGNGGGSVFAQKMKKERMRRLSVVSKANSINKKGEMGCAAAGSDGEYELRSTTTSTTKRFKLPKKFFYDCNTVDHVPRKLRSAMKKRNRDSISPPLPDDKPNHRINGDGFPRKIGTKKSRLNQQGGDYSNGSQSVGPITKDEEEVVETLYALADMFPSNNENGSDGELTEAKSRPLPEGENSKPPFEAPEEKDSKSLCPSNKAEEGFLEGSDQETVEVKCWNRSSLPGSPKSIQLQTNCEDAISQTNGQAMSQSELSQRICSKQTKHKEAAACARKPEVEVQVNSLPLAGSHGVGTKGPSLQSPSDITFLGTAVSATPSGSVNNCPLSNKDSRGPVARKKSWKRCSAHVYISRLIKVFQIAEKTDRSPAQLTSNEESKQGVGLTTENLHGVRNGLNGFVSGHRVVASAAENNTNEVRNESLLHKRLLLDQQQASTTSPFYASQKQNFDFLALSNGGSGVEASNSLSKLGNGLDPSTQIQIPYPFMPFSVSENCFSSALSTYHLQVAAAKQVHIQSPPYMGSQLLGSPHLSNTASPKQQQQRWIWTPQLAAAQQNLVGSCIPNWQHGRHEYPSSAVHYAQNLAGSQPILPPSYSSLEVLGPKYAPLSQQQQQQQFISVTSSPLHTAKSKRQYQHHLPSRYDINGVGSHSDAAQPLQLVCNDHL